MSEVRLTEEERASIWAARKGAPWSFDPNWLQKAERAIEQIIAARLVEVAAERDEWRSATGDPTPDHHRATTAELRASLEELARQRDASLAENARLCHLLGSHADGSQCTCEMTRPGSHIEPPEWEQDPWCPTHPDMNQIVAEVARLRDTLARVEALAAAMDAEANDYSARHPERSYDKGADDQLDADRRLLRAALAGGDQ